MCFGKTVFTQLMDFLFWKIFHRIVDRCNGGSLRQIVDVCRTVSRDGLHVIERPREPAGHRGLPVGAIVEALTHGIPPRDQTLDTGRSQRKAELAYPRVIFCGRGRAAGTVGNTEFYVGTAGFHTRETVGRVTVGKLVERAMRIELTASAWEAEVLPLYDARRGRHSTTVQGFSTTFCITGRKPTDACRWMRQTHAGGPRAG